MNLRVCAGIWIVLFAGWSSKAQIRVSQVDATKWVKESLAGKGVVIGNVKFHGSVSSIGSFTSSKVLEIQKGIVLSTGLASKVSGLNNKPNQTYSFGDAENDADLKKFIKPNLYDISLIEFDFVPLENSFQFNYQFGSEEYPEYVGSTYNDVFGFFVSADSITKNIANIPGQDIPVSINAVNHQTNAGLFLNNNVFSNDAARRAAPVLIERKRRGLLSRIFSSASANEDDGSMPADATLVKNANSQLYRNLQFDGITKKLVAQTYVLPYKKYHLKIIIADVADNIYDSGVFIENNSLTAKRDTSQANFVNYPDISKIANPDLILAGKKLEDILPDTVYLHDANIYFDFDKTDISYSELRKLKGIAAIYDRVKNKYTMRVAGHTDSIGNLEYNMELSRKRNQAVMDALQHIRVIDVPIEITEDAFLKPAASNETEEGRERNRRVEIYFVRD